MKFERRDVDLSNWRTAPYSSWAFQNVSEIVPSAIIAGNQKPESPPLPLGRFASLGVKGADGADIPLPAFLAVSHTHSFVVMRDSAIIAEWHAPTCDPLRPHLIFSISKSITGILAGILISKGSITETDIISKYVPETLGSAYGDATLRNLLDMEVALDFDENYLDKTGGFDRYRRATGWNPQDPALPHSDLKSFLCTIKKSNAEHGITHAYRSPNTDMAGIVLERAAGKRIPELISALIWKPMGAHSDGHITVDKIGTSRTAGGISVTPRDLARFGDMVWLHGNGIVGQSWIDDLWTGGSREAWRIGDQADHFPQGSYRSFWYETGMGELAAIGIHGQWIWIDPKTNTVIIKQSSATLPTDPQMDDAIVAMMRAISHLT